MKETINKIMRWYLRQRMGRILEFIEQPHKVQKQVLLQQLIAASKHTKWGKQFGYAHIKTEEELAKFADRLKDRFGKLPHPVKELFDALRLRWLCKDLGFERLLNPEWFIFGKKL